jgi:penicillin-binding protein 2
MHNSHLSRKNIIRRLRTAQTVLLLLLSVIIATLFYLQVWHNHFFFHRSTKNFLRYEPINSLRGTIVDCNGKPMATNRPVTTLVWHGTGNRAWSPEQTIMLSFLEMVTGKYFLHDEQLLHHERQEQDHVLVYDLPFDQLSKICERIAGQHVNVRLFSDYARFYPHGTIACHVLGYFREHTDAATSLHRFIGSGSSGLEKMFEEQLRGTPGTLEKTINSVGKSLQWREIQQALNGDTLATTIDLELQHLAEKVFPEEQSGSFIVMDPHNGALRVFLSRPAFDPNIFIKQLSSEEWKKIQEERPFINRCMCACYPPASLFKLVTATAALEEGIITQEKTWFCNGEMEFGDRVFHCHHHVGHGTVNLEEALAFSCNIPFYDIGKRISVDKLAHYAEKYGFGQKTGIMFPEKIGLVPNSSWKRKTYGEPWWQGETLNYAIGQGPILVTPLQEVRVFGGLCTGNLVRPRILEDEPIDVQPLNISSKTLQYIKQTLRMTVQRGTGRLLERLKNITIYAKTGTAQTSDLSKRKLGKEFLEHAWFISYAQYKDYDPIVVAIFIENVGSSVYATRVAKKFFVEYGKLMDRRAI